MRLDHVQLAMPKGGDAKARSYFGDLLGMPEELKPDQLTSRGGCWFRLGFCAIHVGVDPHFLPQRKAHPAFAVADLEEVAERLTRAGYDVRWDSSIPGTSRFFTDDPFGNRIEFLADSPDSTNTRSGAF